MTEEEIVTKTKEIIKEEPIKPKGSWSPFSFYDFSKSKEDYERWNKELGIKRTNPLPWEKEEE